MLNRKTLNRIKELRERLTFTADAIYFKNLAKYPEPDKEITVLASAWANAAIALAKVLSGMEPEEAVNQMLENYQKKEEETEHEETD